jgi:hypothetical protein
MAQIPGWSWCGGGSETVRVCVCGHCSERARLMRYNTLFVEGVLDPSSDKCHECHLSARSCSIKVEGRLKSRQKLVVA